MSLLRRAAAILVVCAVSTPRLSDAVTQCPDGWQQLGQHCYRMTPRRIQRSLLAAECRQLDPTAQPISIHSERENSFIRNVAGFNYVWIGLNRIGRDQYAWEDGTQYSYKRFLPRPKQATYNSGILQQSCRRWNFEPLQSKRYGVCKMAACSCPSGAAMLDGQCFFTGALLVPWWEAGRSCRLRDPAAEPAQLSVGGDTTLIRTLTGRFGDSMHIVGVDADLDLLEIDPDNCTWQTLQRGEPLATHRCEIGCPSLHPVICRRRLCTTQTTPQPQPVQPSPPRFKLGAEEDREVGVALSVCPAGWHEVEKRCLSAPTHSTPREEAETLCQQMHFSRVAAVNNDAEKAFIGKLTASAIPVWVRDKRPLISVRFGIDQDQLTPASSYSDDITLLTSGGTILETPNNEYPAICEHCKDGCVSGAATFWGHCYRELEGHHTRSEASELCSRNGGTLVSIESRAENNFVTRLAFGEITECQAPDQEIWLGLSALSDDGDNPYGGGRPGEAAPQRHWAWDDCSRHSAAAWAAGADLGAGNCAVLSPDGRWRTAHCQRRARAVCEWDPCRLGSASCILIGQPDLV